MPHPVFDPVIHEPHRLQICAYLVPEVGRDFGDIRDHLSLSDSALSKHLKALGEQGYVQLHRRVQDGRQVTAVTLTPTGREAMCGHVAELQRMARLVGSARRSPPRRESLR